jgi:poly [ADP-ribose] polymerase
MEKLLVDKYFNKSGEIVNDKILYACTLNQTDIVANKNKFYIIQLIQTSPTTYHIFIRYGRIGERGVCRSYTCDSKDSGMSCFGAEFKKKTGNVWSSDIYTKFAQKKGKYFLSQVDVSDVAVPKAPVTTVVQSKLCERMQYLIKLLSNEDMMNKSYLSLNLNPKKMPLGKIDKKQLTKAREILGDIGKAISDDDEVTDLSSTFYTLIPYSVGRRKPPVIDTPEQIDQYMKLLDELEHMVVTASITHTDTSTDANKLDTIYDDLHSTIRPLDKEDDMWKIINEYVKIADTHKHMNVEVIDIYEISRENEDAVYEKHCEKINNRALLWHGSGLTNWLSIIKNGFRLPNTLSGVVLTGWMFGAGTYFSNMFSKSFGYTRYSDFDGYACLSLSEVALGTQHKITNAEYDINIDKITKYGCHSTYGMGTTTVNQNHKLNGVVIPAGDITKRKISSSLLYDEFIVYDVRQIRQKYLIIVKQK